MSKTTNRQEWIDMMKGIAIISVVAFHSDFHFHSSTLLPLWSLLANSWHVGVFFVLSGFFIKEEKLQRTFQFVRGKFSSLYVRLLFAYAICIMLRNPFFSIGFYDETFDYGGKFISPYSVPDTLLQLLLAIFGAGREPILGALWFVYCLFASMIVFAIISKLLRKAFSSDRTYELARCITLFSLCAIIHGAQEIFHLFIPRYENIFTISWLIYLGYLCRNKLHLQFNSVRIAAIAFVLFYLCNVIFGANRLVTNDFHNVISMTVCIMSATYFLAFICKKTEGTLFCSVLSLIGRNSFHIMTWHLLAFKLLTLVLNAIGLHYSLANLNSPETDNLPIYLLYTVVGVLLPTLLFSIFRGRKMLLF